MDGEEDLFPDLDPEMKAKLLHSGSTGFRFGGSIRPDTSLMLFVKKRAKRGFVGFVDVTTLAPVTSPQNRGVRVFNEVVNAAVPRSSEFLQNSFEEQLKYLNHAKHGATAKQLLLTETLPRHDYERNLVAISDCLLADSPAVRHDAAVRLERLMIATDYCDIVAAKNQLLTVAQKTHQIITDPVADLNTKDSDHFRMCGYLHVVAMAAMMCRGSHHPILEECKVFMAWPKIGKKQSGDDVKHDVLKLMQAFYENIERHLKEHKSKLTLPVCTDRKKFPKAALYEQITSFFLILNQLANDDWTDEGKKFVKEMEGFYDAVSKDGKRGKPEARAGLDTLLIRGLVVILSTTFAKVRQEIGDESYDHPVLIGQLLAFIAGRVDKEHMKTLLPHLSVVAFHESPEVRHIVTELLEKHGQPLLHVALDHLEANVGVADFHVDHKSGSGQRDTCSWHVLKGQFGQERAECSVFVHTTSCKAKTASTGLSECAEFTKEDKSDDLKQHVQNLQMLVHLSPHDHVLKLMAFQLSPFLFYATEHIKGRRLLEHLINQRAAHRWLDSATLCNISHDIISGLEYLASRNIASRDITAYDILVEGRSRRGGRAGEMVDVLMTENFRIKLANLGLAHQFRGEDRRTICRVTEQGLIPLLWTPQEALRSGEYTEQSMVYSAGCVMYELWTHGCQPFTSYQKTTSETIRMMLLMPDSVPLIRWPCIPDDVYEVMRQCTSFEPAARPSLPKLKRKLMEMFMSKKSQGESHDFEMEAERELSYPSFCDDQVQRKHVPERGIPQDIQQIIDDYRINHSDSYRNMRTSRWMDYMSSSQVATASELNSPNWIEITYLKNYTCVREKFTAEFKRDQLPLLEKHAANASSRLPGLTDWMKSQDNKPSLEEDPADHIVHERRYNPSWTIQDAACKGLLVTSESGYVAMELSRYVHVLLSLSRVLYELHQAGWLHRDVRASNVLVDCKTGQASLVRLGRMCRVASPTGTAVDDPFQDSWRWQAPEVLSEGQFKRENDVFMLGTTFWEVFWSREITEKDPTATEVNYLPFADHAKEHVLKLVRERKPLPKPSTCPEWLYQLSAECRHPDPAMRPSTAHIVSILEKGLTNRPDPDRQFLPHPKLLATLHGQLSEEGEEVPELPARFTGKRIPAVPPRNSGICENWDGRAPSPPSILDLGSISLSISRGDTIIASRHGQASDEAGYLTPLSDEVQYATAGRAVSFDPIQTQIAGQAFYAEAASFANRKQKRSSSESDLSASEFGLSMDQKDKTRSYSTRGRVTRNIPGLGSLQRVQASDYNGRTLPLPPLPTVPDDEHEHVYNEIRDQHLASGRGAKPKSSLDKRESSPR